MVRIIELTEFQWKLMRAGLMPGLLFTEKQMAVGDVKSNEVGSGARFNDGKVRYDLIPTHLLASTANVLEYGANKYAPWNWAKGMKFSVVIASLKRHMAALERGEDYDPETGERHTGHLMCNLLFLEHYMNEYPEMDDRPKEWFNRSKEAEPKQKEENVERGYTKEQQSHISEQLSSKYKDSVEQRRVPDVPKDIRTPHGDYIIYPATGDGGMAGYYRPDNHRF